MSAFGNDSVVAWIQRFIVKCCDFWIFVKKKKENVRHKI